MSERGVFAMDRGWFDHPTFAPEPFTEREAWAWMISSAAFRPHRRRIGKFAIDLKRGQLAASIRYLAETWKWHRAKADRFLLRLLNDQMIETDVSSGLTLITVRNYNKYQRVSLPDETATETPTETLIETPIGPPNETVARHLRDNIEDLEYKEEEQLTLNKTTPTGAVACATRPAAVKRIFEEQFWPAYPKREGANPKKPALEKFIQAVKNEHDPTLIVAGAARYRDEIRKVGKEGTVYVAQAVTWLSQARWEDYAIPPPTGGGDPAYLKPPPGARSLEEIRAQMNESSHG